MREYADVYRYPRLRKVHQLTDAELAETPSVAKDDPDDDHFLTAADTGCTACLVTGDPHLLKLGSYKETSILSPAEFLARFSPDRATPIIA